MTRDRFIQLLEKEQEGLLKFLLALCDGNYPEAEDLAQETSLKAYLSYRGYVERFKFSTWLYRIAYNSFIDHRRKKSIPTVPLEAESISRAQRDLAETSLRDCTQQSRDFH